MGEDTEGSDAAGAKFLAEVVRLLKPRKGSVYVCVSLAQAHVLSRPHSLPSSSPPVAFSLFVVHCASRKEQRQSPPALS